MRCRSQACDDAQNGNGKGHDGQSTRACREWSTWERQEYPRLSFGDRLGTSAERYSQLGNAAYALLYMVARRLVDAGVGMVLESNFYRGFSERELAPVVARTRAVQVHCGGDAEVIVPRYRARAERGERHAGHDDLAAIPRLQDHLATGRCEPLDLAIPTLRVNTTMAHTVIQYAPAFDDILAFITADA